jgi:hypothetical protein
LEQGLADELTGHWGVRLADLPPRDYGWGFVKLEPLFRREGERFLVLDSDTVITGPVLESWNTGGGPFLVDDESQGVVEKRRLYYDWERLREHVPQTLAPSFVFNSGQWFGTGGMLSRDDFEPVLAWNEPPKLRRPECFMGGDQGVLNWVLNQKAALDGLGVARRSIMRWPKRSMDGLSPAEVASGAAPALVVHWAGLKRPRLNAMIGADLLAWFEKFYYARLPNGSALRRTRAARYVLPPRLALVSEQIRQAERALEPHTWGPPA